MVGEQALLLAAAEAAVPRQARYDWHRKGRGGGVPWHVLGPLYVAKGDTEPNLPTRRGARSREVPRMDATDVLRLIAYVTSLESTNREAYELVLHMIRKLPPPTDPEVRAVLRLVPRPLRPAGARRALRPRPESGNP